MKTDTLGKHITNATTFYGACERPFLAPRGVWVHDNVMAVSDTGNNRVLIWNSVPNSEYQNPNVIIGHDDINTTERPKSCVANANTLYYPSGIWHNKQVLIVADAWHHRVLIWHCFPTKDNQPADVVIGQSDFRGTLPNESGIATSPTSKSLHWPYGVYSDGHHLWIADTGNRRVLYYDSIPLTNGCTADRVLGKVDFYTKDYNIEEPIWPYSVRVSKRGELAITDTQCFRVLLWYDWKSSFSKEADVIIGQATLEGCGQNQNLLTPTGKSLNWLYDIAFYKDGIFVIDTGNSRILWFKDIPKVNNTVADALIGRPDFNTSSEYGGNLKGTKDAIYWPFSLIVSNDTMFIADTGNHRLVIGHVTL